MGWAHKTIPDYESHLFALKEEMEELLLQISEDQQAGVNPTVSCLEVYDSLSQFLDAVKAELGM